MAWPMRQLANCGSANQTSQSDFGTAWLLPRRGFLRIPRVHDPVAALKPQEQASRQRELAPKAAPFECRETGNGFAG